MAGTWNGTTFFGDDSNDTANGSAASEGIYGGRGNDALSGGGGNDFMDGGVDSDTLRGGDGNDVLTDVQTIPSGFSGPIGRDALYGDAGDDELRFYSIDTGDVADGGAGDDVLRVSFANVVNAPTVSFALGVNGIASTFVIGGVSCLAVSRIERLIFSGGSNSDFITGAAGNDLFSGEAGDDHLFGGAGNDFIDGGSGVQDLNGGADFDTVSFDVSGFALDFNIANGSAINLGIAGNVTNFEAFYEIRTGMGADSFTITQTGSVTIYAGEGGDNIQVITANSEIFAQGGDDLIVTGEGGDEIDGGSGNNTARMGAGNDKYYHEDSRAYTGSENVQGEAGNDQIYTGAGADFSYGGIGNDRIYSGGGADQGFGGAGDDDMQGENGADLLYGGDGNDRLEADEEFSGIDSTIDADQLFGGLGNDYLTGGLGADSLYGGVGDDRLVIGFQSADGTEPEPGVDIVNGGNGTDTLNVIGGVYTDSYTLDVRIVAGNATVLMDGVATAQASQIEALEIRAYGSGAKVLYGGIANDRVTTGQGNDDIRTYIGNDTILSDYGADTVQAGAGDDVVSLSLGGADRVDMGAGNDGVTLSTPYLSQVVAAGVGVIIGGAGVDTLTLYASDRAMAFNGRAILLDGVRVATVQGFEVFNWTGNGLNNRLTGAALNDTLFGGAGDDTLLGLGGNDSLSGGTGNDALTGGIGADTLVNDAGANLLDCGNGNDSISGLVADALVDTIIGGAGDDWLTLPFPTAGPVVMTGSLQTGATLTQGGVTLAQISGIEHLTAYGTAFSDALLGGDGSDVLNLQSGSDTVLSGGGNDTVTCVIDAGTDVIDLGAGVDTVTLTFGAGATGNASFVLSAAANVLIDGLSRASVAGAEAVMLYAGSGNDSITGGALADYLSGGLGENILTGLGGDDQFVVTMDGLLDRIFGGAATDKLMIYGGSGQVRVDVTSQPGVYLVNSGLIPAIEAHDIESVVIYGGGVWNDVMIGLDGNDTLYGYDGDDRFNGGNGNDVINGGTGADTLIGGAGADRFEFNSPAMGPDTIRDFEAGDVLALSAFNFANAVAGSAVTLIRGPDPTVPASQAAVYLYDTDSGALSFDRDGAGVASAVLIATLRSGAAAATLNVDQILLY